MVCFSPVSVISVNEMQGWPDYHYLLPFIASRFHTYYITCVLTEVTVYTYLTVLTEITLNLLQ